MIRVAILAPPGPHLAEMTALLGRFTVKEFRSIEVVNQELRHFPFDVIVLQLPIFSSAQIASIQKIRSRFPEAGIITLSSKIDPSARYEVRSVPRHQLLQDPMERADLPALVERFQSFEATSIRLHPRVRREDACEIVDVESGQRFRARFVDFAQMGARVLVQSHLFTKNQRVQLHYHSTSERGKIHRIESKIVWSKISTNFFESVLRGPHQIAGLRFVAAL